MKGFLGTIERSATRCRTPAILFLALTVVMIGLSQIVYRAGTGPGSPV